MAQTKTATATTTATNINKSKWTPELRAAQAERMRQRRNNPEFIEKMRAGMDVRKSLTLARNEEKRAAKKAARAARPKKVATPEECAEMRAKVTKAWAEGKYKRHYSAETRAKMSAARKAFWASPKGIAQHMAIAKGHSNSAMRKFDALAAANKQAVIAVIENAKAQLDAIALA